MEDKFKIIIPAILIIALFGTLLVVFNRVYSDLDSEIISNLETVTITNVTSQQTFQTGVDSNTTNTMSNFTNRTTGSGRLIRNTPQLTCSRVFIYHNLSGGVSPTPRKMELDRARPDFICNTSSTGQGRLWLRLHGNTTNNTAQYGFNVTYTAAVYGGAWNVSMEQRQALSEGASQSGTYYSLLILAVILSIVMAYVGIKIGTGGFGGGGGDGGGFSLDSITDKFER